ncbi:hypothetical protein Nepgr_029240 [Nepenthes gracilis]|uniref:WW domain-containing protein n=1 Tax=Nepenthes gracilis TaxID=150966 RepID=A0AAD3TDL2_NEPGR|nr:hypothetical protein Nepgr_029240 [Nepenthes gracilis]
MSAPNMATLTESLERSLKSCSLNQSSTAADGGLGQSSSSNAPRDRPPRFNSDSNSNSSFSDTTLVELNSHISLPYHWQQCLDLKTGEIYYINWRNGTKAKEDPRLTGDNFSGDYSYSEEDDSEGSWTESSASPPRDDFRGAGEEGEGQRQKDVLVVGGCKSCLMYFMVPKHVQDCPKCNAHLLHCDPSDNASL